MITVTLLVENTARGAGLLGEHGLAWWLDTGRHRVLFDTGQGMALRSNAAALGLELARADAIVLSHGHYDHVGGLEAALAAAPDAALHLHPRAVEPKFSGANPGAPRRISTAFVEAERFRAGGRRMVATTEPSEVVPGIRCTGEIPRTNDFEDTGGPFYLDAELRHPDPLLDDQALFFSSAEGTVVVLGCAHAGVINTLEHIWRLTGRAPIHTVMGGLHLENASRRRLRETVRWLRRFGVRRLGAVHCTGWVAAGLLRDEFPAQCFSCATGTRLVFAPAPAA